TRTVGLTIEPQSAPVTDSVAITRAEFVTSKGELRVEATSSNASATLTVFVSSTNATIGTLTGDGSGRFRGIFSVSPNPKNITVRSSGGGSATGIVVAK